MNLDRVTADHGVNGRIKKIAVNFEVENVAVILRGNADVRHGKLRRNHLQPGGRFGTGGVHRQISWRYIERPAGPAGGAGASGAALGCAWMAPSRPSTFTRPELEGTMYFVFWASVLLSTSRRRIISARSLKYVSA